MFKYQVQSGPLKITLVAETSYDAAVEAVRWWGERVQQMHGNSHRQALAEDLIVRGQEGSNRVFDRFATFNLLAEAAGQTPEEAWEKLIDATVANWN
jgi:hypothetical protein